MSRETRVVVGVIGALVAGCDPPEPKGPAPLCASRWGDGMGQRTTGLGVDAAGNFVVAGENGGTIDFGAGPLPSGPFVAKFDPNCQHVWSKAYPREPAVPEGVPPEPGLSNVVDIAVDPAGNVIVSSCFLGEVDVGGGLLTAEGPSDMILFKLDPTGAHVWSKRFGDAESCRQAEVEVDPGGNVLLAGFTFEVTEFSGAPAKPYYVAKLDGDGALLWSKQWDSARADELRADAAGNVIISGGSWGPTDFGGGPLGGTDDSLFIVKFGPDGAYAWGKVFPTTTDVGDGPSMAMDVAPSGEIALAGRNYGTVDFGGGVLTEIAGGDAYMAKLDAAGEHLWSKIVGDAALQQANGVAIDPKGNMAVIGSFDGTLDFGNGAVTQAYIVKFTAEGSAAWSRGDGDGDVPDMEAVALDGAGNVITAGTGRGPLDFGNGVLTGNSGDLLIVKFAP